jgi:peptidoglycan-associated lipoprotein
MITSKTLTFTALLLSASLIPSATGCASQAAAPVPAEVPHAPLPKATPALEPTVDVSPGLTVSEEIVRVCNLDFDNVDRAPKFDFDESSLLSQDQQVISRIAECVTTGPLAGRAVALIGHADPRGGRDYNQALGERRANSVLDRLSTLGVGGAQLAASSRGKQDATGTDETGWSRDRRVDILLR